MRRLLTLLNPGEAQRYYAAGSWTRDTLYTCLVRHAAERPDAHALRDAALRLTWRQVHQWVDAVAEQFHAAGVRKGERVAVWIPSRAESVITLLACARNGYVCTPSLHQNYRVDEILTLLDRTKASALVVQPGHGSDANRHDVIAAAAGLDHMRLCLTIDGSHAQAVPYAASDVRVAASTTPDDDPDRVIYLAFTSGTTGAPKGVMHSHNTLLANGRAMVAAWQLDAATVLLSLSPMSHHIGTVAVEQMLSAGCELVVNDVRAGRPLLDVVVGSGATYVMGVPTHAMDVLAQMTARGVDALGRVRLFYMAGSPIPSEVARRFLEMGVTPQNIYGMTENGSHQFTIPSDDARTIVETCGHAAPGFETAIFDQVNPDIALAEGEVGEIATRGPLLMLGYFDDQLVTEASFNRDGWFLSGDLGTLDARGCLRIVGRKKDLIIRGGHNIHPARIEDLAHRHPSVTKAAAFGVADERLGEKVCLAVIVRDAARVSALDMLDHLFAAGLSKYDMPEYFAIVDGFPLTASGKVLKRELIDWTRSGRLQPEPVRFTEQERTAS